MIESLRSMAMLVAVLDEQSFQAAADKLGVSATVISQNIKALEVRMDCVLLDRSTRVLRPTEAGLKVIGPARAMLSAAQAGMQSLAAQSEEVVGKVVVSVPTMLSSGILAEMTQDFLLANPRVQMDLRFENAQRHPIYDDVDLVIGFDRIIHENVAHRALVGGGGGFYAAPDLAERIERTELAQILLKIPLLMSYGFSSSALVQAFAIDTIPKGQQLPFRMKCDDVSIIYRMCLSGAGMTVLPHSLVGEDVKRGRLVQVLKHIKLEHTEFKAMWHEGAMNAPIVESFLDHIEGALQHRRRVSERS